MESNITNSCTAMLNRPDNIYCYSGKTSYNARGVAYFNPQCGSTTSRVMSASPGPLRDEKSSLCPPVPLGDKPLDANAGSDSFVSTGGKTAIGYVTLPRRTLIRAERWHPGRPITRCVSLATMPKIHKLLNEAEAT